MRSHARRLIGIHVTDEGNLEFEIYDERGMDLLVPAGRAVEAVVAAQWQVKLD